MDEIKNLEKQAIDAAFSNNWQEAVKLNKKILKLDKKNLEAILRLGFSYFQLQRFDEAKKIYQKGLKIQPNHPVILNYLQKIEAIEERKEKEKTQKKIVFDPELFLEIPGKTKSVALVNLGQKNVLAKLSIGQKVLPLIRRRKVIIKTENNEFIGNLPDDIGKRLIILIKGGNKYLAFIKEVSLNRVVVFLKEEEKSKKFKNIISFPSLATKNFSKIMKKEEENKEDEENLEETNEELPEELLESHDLEKLAETLTEEKEEDYLSFVPEDEENFEEEE